MLPPAEDGAQGGEKRKKDKQTTNCTPFCGDNCEFQGQHNSLIMSLVTLQESDRASMDAWKKYVKNVSDINKPLQDANPSFLYSLLQWAAILGKVKAVQWLLTEENNTQGIVHDETVLFLMVRYLHEGVKSKDANQISKIFLNILNLLLKRDPNLLLVQEGSNSNTVLHLCAQGEKGSTAPFLMYLRRTLLRLKEVSNKSESLDELLKNILERRNKQGDTFIEVAAKCKTQKEARELIELIRDRDFVLSVHKAEEILDKRKRDETEIADDDQNGNDVEDNVGMDDGDGDSENEADDKEQELEVNNTFEQGGSAENDLYQAPLAKIPKIADEFSTFSENPLPGAISLQSVCSQLQPQWDDNSESKVTPSAVRDPAEAGLVTTYHGLQLSTWDQLTISAAASRTESAGNELVDAKVSVERLVQKTEEELLQERNQLKKAEFEMKKLQEEKEKKDTEISRRKESVEAIEQKLMRYKESLKKLD